MGGYIKGISRGFKEFLQGFQAISRGFKGFKGASTVRQASDAETVPPEVAQAAEERLEEQRTLEMSLRDALAPKILEVGGRSSPFGPRNGSETARFSAFSSREETKSGPRTELLGVRSYCRPASLVSSCTMPEAMKS